LPELVVGDMRFIKGSSVIQIDGQLLLGFAAPEAQGAPIRLTARFWDNRGVEVFRIDHNEFAANPASWDVENVGQVFRVRNPDKSIALELRHVPGERLEIPHANIFMNKYHVRIHARGMTVTYGGSTCLDFGGGTVYAPGGPPFILRNGGGAVRGASFSDQHTWKMG
jgi:hypothetical protein